MPRLPVPSRFEQFELLQFLALGLSGEVYKARYKDSSLVALKVFNKEKDKTVFGYFANEQLLLREVTRHRQHPHIVEYVASNLVLPPYYLATRYIDGARSLGTLLGASLNPGFVLGVVEQIANALDYLHYDHPTYSPIVHRDVKPDNILIDVGGNAILIDLSIATHPGYALDDARGLGTPRYMAPEQYLGEEVPATDQFALATVALHMLVGRPLLPSNPKTARRKLEELRDSQFAEVHKQLGSRARTAEVIAHAMQFDPQQRYESCAEFAERLCQALLADGQALLDESPPAQRAGGYVGYLVMAFAGALAVAILFLALTGFWSPPPVPAVIKPTDIASAGVLAATLKPTVPLIPDMTTPTMTPMNTPVECSRNAWVVTDNSEPLRAGPSTQELVLDRMPRGAALTLLACETQEADSVSWYHVIYKNQSGWSRVSSVGSAPPLPKPTAKPRPKPTVTLTPEPPTAPPEPPTVAPEAPTVAPEAPTVAPEPPTVAPEPPTVAPEPPTVAPEPPTVAPEPPTAAPEPPTAP